MKLNLTDKLQKKLIDNSYKAFQNSESKWQRIFGLMYGKIYVRNMEEEYNDTLYITYYYNTFN